MENPASASPDLAPAVAVSGLTKRFGSVSAVDDVSLSIPAGSVYGLLGPNGSGKTTLLSLLAGFLTPTAGEVRLLGEAGAGGLARARSRMGVLIERPIFWPHLSCRDTLRNLQGIYCRRADPEEVDRLLELVGLDGGASRTAFQACSTGMKQRLGIAAALLDDPALLILDEPTNGLDPVGIVEVRELVRRLARDGADRRDRPRTVVLASHLLNEVELVCDWVGVMGRGRLLFSGPVAEIGGHPPVKVRTTDDAGAIAALTAGGWTVQSDDPDGLLVSVAPGSEWEVSRRLSEAGIYIAEMRPTSGSLESGFLEVTAAERDQS